MDIEEKIRRLEEQFLFTNKRLTELSDRLIKVEELVANQVIARPRDNANHEILHDHIRIDSEELYQRMSKLASDFNNTLPDLADVLTFRTGASSNKDGRYGSVHSTDVKSKSGGRKEVIQPNPFIKRSGSGSSVVGSVVISQEVPNCNENGSKSVRNSSSTSDEENGAVGGVPERKKSAIHNSAQRLKQSDEVETIMLNGTQQLRHSSSSGTKNDVLQRSGFEIKSHEQLPDVPLADLLSKLVTREPESKNAYFKSTGQSLTKKTVAVFEENPWDDELDKIPWEGTGSFDKNDDHGLKGQKVSDSLTNMNTKLKQIFAPCTKVCGTLTGHPCKIQHDPTSSCPPCTTLIKNFKLKCNHRTDVLCHRQGKISEYCSECDAKRLVKVEQDKPALSRPTLSLAMDPIQSESEAAFKKVKEILNKLTSSNFEKLSEDFMTIVNAQTKYLPEIASALIEKAMLDVENPLSPANYAKLASKTINSPQGELKMFRIEVVTLAVLIFTTVLFSNNTDGSANNLPYFVKMLLKRKEISDLDPKRRNLGVLRFVGELFNQDVISMSTLQTDVIDPLIANPTEENLEYLCKLLTLVGHKIHEKVAGSSSSSSWFEGLFAKLKPFCDNSSISTQVRFSVQNLHDLKEVNWDRFKKPKVQTSTLKAAVDIGSTSSVFSNGSSSAPTISGKSRKAKKKKQAPTLIKQEAKIVPTILPTNLNPSDVFDPWESAPWGEHTDPLAVAFPRLDSPGLMSGNFSSPSVSGKATPSDSGWKGSQTSVTFAKALSTASSRVISPAISTSSLNSAHSSLPHKIDAVAIFNMYVSIHTAPQKNRLDLLRCRLAGCEEKQLRDFIRDLSRHTVQLTKKMKVAALGQLVDVLLKSKIVSEELVSKGFQSGIISDLPIIHKSKSKNVFEELVCNVATIVVTVWSERMTNFTWLFELGRNIVLYPEVWCLFSTEVLAIVLERKKDKFTKNCFENTIEGRDYLRKQAVALKIVHQ